MSAKPGIPSDKNHGDEAGNRYNGTRTTSDSFIEVGRLAQSTFSSQQLNQMLIPTTSRSPRQCKIPKMSFHDYLRYRGGLDAEDMSEDECDDSMVNPEKWEGLTLRQSPEVTRQQQDDERLGPEMERAQEPPHTSDRQTQPVDIEHEEISQLRDELKASQSRFHSAYDGWNRAEKKIQSLEKKANSKKRKHNHRELKETRKKLKKAETKNIELAVNLDMAKQDLERSDRRVIELEAAAREKEKDRLRAQIKIDQESREKFAGMLKRLKAARADSDKSDAPMDN